MTGDLHVVDRDRLEREMAAGDDAWNLDPAGAPVAGKTVTATFTEFIPHREQTGTRYDFIEKKVVPVYDYTSTERDAGTIKVKTDRDGDFSLSIPTSTRGSEYRVRVSATDPDSHAARWTGWANEAGQRGEAIGALLVLTDGGVNPEGEFGIGDRIDLTMTDPSVKADEADRYLFYSAQRGLRDAVVQTSARYRVDLRGVGRARDLDHRGLVHRVQVCREPGFQRLSPSGGPAAHCRAVDERPPLRARRQGDDRGDDPGPDGRSCRGHGRPASGGRKAVRSRGR